MAGASFDASIRLEPSQVAGFLQSYRSLISESLVGEVAGSRFKLTGLSLEQKLPTRTYLGVGFDVREQKVDRTVGVFESLEGHGGTLAVVPSALGVRDEYREEVFTAALNQLVGEDWSLGARYRYTHSKYAPEFGAPECFVGNS